MVPAGVRDLIRGQIAGMSASKLRAKLSRTFLSVAPDIESIYFDNFAVFPRAAQNELLTSETLERTGGVDPYAGVRRVLSETDAHSLLDRLSVSLRKHAT